MNDGRADRLISDLFVEFRQLAGDMLKKLFLVGWVRLQGIGSNGRNHSKNFFLARMPINAGNFARCLFSDILIQ